MIAIGFYLLHLSTYGPTAVLIIATMLNVVANVLETL